MHDHQPRIARRRIELGHAVGGPGRQVLLLYGFRVQGLGFRVRFRGLPTPTPNPPPLFGATAKRGLKLEGSGV